LEKLVQPGTLEDLAREQAKLDTSENPSSRLGQLTKTRDTLRSKRDNLIDSLALTDDLDTRTTLLARAKELGQMIAEAERDLEAYARLAADWETKSAILRNVTYQMRRYAERILPLRVDNPNDAPFIRTIILSLGVTPIVSIENGNYKVVNEYHLGAGTAKPWFPTEELDDGGPVSLQPVRQVQLRASQTLHGAHGLPGVRGPLASDYLPGRVRRSCRLRQYLA
jgi:hypothetical protein